MIIFTFVIVIFCSLPMPSLGTMTSSSNSTPPSPCVEDRDPDYDGVRVNCQHKGISSLPLPAHWIPRETSSLLLDYNSLVYLNKTSFSTFSTWTRLRLLRLSHNSISHIESCTFSKFVSLRILDLGSNNINLDRNSLSGHEFDGLVNLSELTLENNNNEDHEGTYPTSLLSSLHNLQSLALDTFFGDLKFSKQFHVPRRLSSLFLSGGMKRIKNESLESFSSINITKLSIRYCSNLQHIETGALRLLESVLWYEVRYFRLGLRDVLESLAPFVNRIMSHLIITGLFFQKPNTKSFGEGSVLTVHIARYLSQICVENFVLTSNGIFVIESYALSSPIWMRCLRTLDLSHNPILGEVGAIYSLHLMRRLEVLKVMNVRYAFASHRSVVWQPPTCPCKVNSSTFGAMKTVEGTKAQSFGRNDNVESQSISVAEINKTYLTLGPSNSALPPRFYIKATAHGRRRRELQPSTAVIKYYVPKHLRIIMIDSFSDYFLRFDENAQYKNGENLEEVHLSDNGARNFTGSYSGLTNLKILDVSRNVGSLMSPNILSSFSSVAHLNVAEMKLDSTFMKEHSSELFSPLTHLLTLNLSINDLRGLSKDTFDANSKLRVLLLAGNRFESIPFDVSHVPHLCLLDLSGNALKELSAPERTKLDRHYDNFQAFSLRLDGNPFHCGCHSIRFLSWLKRTHINLDNQGNYSCTSDFGMRTTTGNMQDLDVLWRKCNGETSFFISLVLSCFMISGFFLSIFTFKFKTQLKAFLLRKFWPPFILKTPADYAIGVYIGYADQDRTLACHRIRQFIEEELGLSTYVRHRDLLPASDMAEAIVEAVHSSWRVLFVVSNHFLTDPWSYFALKASTYAAQVDNPGRIVLILTDGDDQDEPLLCQLPTCVLRAVQEQSIVTMTLRGQISYEDKQALVTALLYQGYFFDD